MILARDERIFLIILAVNLVVALVYLLGGSLFVVPVQAEDEEEKEYQDPQEAAENGEAPSGAPAVVDVSDMADL